MFSSNHLTHLDVRKCGLHSEGVASLVHTLSGDNLHTLDLSDNSIDIEGIASLSVGLKNYSQLVELNLSDNSIGSIGLKHLAEGLQHCTNLQVLYEIACMSTIILISMLYDKFFGVAKPCIACSVNTYIKCQFWSV